MNSSQARRLPSVRPLFLLVPTLLFLSTISISILTRAQHLSENNNFRCSHKPPSESQPANHVWLNDASFSTDTDESAVMTSDLRQPTDSGSNTSILKSAAAAPRTDITSNGSSSSKGQHKRHVEPQENLLPRDEGFKGSVWGNIFNRLSSVAADHPPAVRDDFVPMKIQVYYDQSVHELHGLKKDLIVEKVIPSVKEFFEGALSIRREDTVEKFRISRRCPNNTVYYVRDPIGSSRAYCMDRCEDFAICGEMLVPPGHLSACSYCNSTSKRCMTNPSSEGKGVSNAQLLLYVSAKQTARCKRDQTIAYAAHCAQDSKTDRPVAGHANLCPASISTDAKDLKALIATVKHELTHVLGFSVSLFAYYRDANGRPLTQRDPSPGPLPVDPLTGYAKWSDKIIKKFVRTNWLTGEGRVDKEIHMMVTPTVVREVRNHFNCSSLEGAELEDQGSDGTSMTHWEKRLFENEAMTGTHTQNSVYSRISLAVLQDTGWYRANFSRAERLEWGQNLGCDFAKKSCKSWIVERRAKQLSIRPFCDRVKQNDLLQMACTEDRISKAVCNVKQFKEPLPLVYQNFDYLEGVPNASLPYYGGAVDLADHCPFIQEFTWLTQNISARGSRCDQTGINLESERNPALESYGPQTKCFEHGRRWEHKSCVLKRHWQHFGAGCYRYSCQDGHYSVMIGNHSYHCYYPDQHLKVEQIIDHWLYNGTLICPACDKICAPNKCRSFDRAYIDKILNYGHIEHNYDHSGNNSTSETMFGILDESVNFIDSNSNSADSNETKKSHEFFKYKDLWQMISQHKRPPRYSLVCSGTSPTISINHSISALTLLAALASTLFHHSFTNQI